MTSPLPQEERENLARTIGSIWETLSSPNLATPTSTTSPNTTSPNTTSTSTASTSTTSNNSAPTSASSPISASSPTSASPTSAATTSEQPHIDVRHDTCHVNMSLNTDALAAELSRRDERHEERIPCRNREAHERGPRVEQEVPNFVFGDAARQQRSQPAVQMQYSNSNTTVKIRDISHRQVGLNIGADGRNLGLNLGDMPVAGRWQLLLTFQPSNLVVILCFLLAIWFFRG
ncbi:hypothetical protein F4782DRAFT_495565 [Xylaria castorea]|nr:hypothetical protein F4782DRAFT_495565 [Xylaria castorea]